MVVVDGNVVVEDGSVVVEDGSVVFEDGSVVVEGGSVVALVVEMIGDVDIDFDVAVGGVTVVAAASDQKKWKVGLSCDEILEQRPNEENIFREN